MIDSALNRIGGACFAERHGRKVRFILAGALNTLVGLFAYPVLFFALKSFGVGYLYVLVISQVLCISFSYLTNKFFVFKTQGNYSREILKFISFHGIYFVINVVVLWVLVDQMRFSPVWSQLGFAGLVIITSYIWHSKITFMHRKR